MISEAPELSQVSLKRPLTPVATPSPLMRVIALGRNSRSKNMLLAQLLLFSLDLSPECGAWYLRYECLFSSQENSGIQPVDWPVLLSEDRCLV